MSSEKVNILCLKWGKLYGPEYVNRLYAGVKKNLSRPFRFVCVTDNPEGLVEGVDAVGFPSPPPSWKHSWPNIFVKLMVFKNGFADLSGPTLFLDIDQVITGDLGCFFDFEPGKFCIIRNWIEWRKRLFRGLPKIGNSSCFRFEAGKMNHVYEKFLSEQDKAVNRDFYTTEQVYMTHAVGLKNISWWPNGWIWSFKRNCSRIFPMNLIFTPKKPDSGARIVCFHGRPSPQQAIEGFKGKGHLNQITRPAKWVLDYWYE